MNPFKKVFWYIYRPQVHMLYDSPIYYRLPNRGRTLNTLPGILPFFLKRKFMDFTITERIAELPFVLTNVELTQGAKVLEIGCAESRLSIELATLGYTVTGYDLRDYALVHPNFTFIKGDFLENELPPASFDCVISVSTLEHCGIDTYGGPVIDKADARIVEAIRRVLKAGGRFIFTVPFGKRGMSRYYRVYDAESLTALLPGFKVIREGYFRTKDRKTWLLEKKENLAQVDSTDVTRGVACIACEKV